MLLTKEFKEDEPFEIRVGGKRTGQTLYNKYKLLDYMKRLEPNKFYGIGKLDKGIIILTESEMIPRTKIENKIKELEENVADFEKTDNTGRFKKENSTDYYKLIALKELLEES